uniref:N-acetyltransferase domain-containing protein n=1 Tax=Sphaeramia orbicularis TaxID=375764 RepID=A0A673AGB2_9TELE
MDFSIRAANVEDCKDIARMITELAEYEKVTDQVKITQRDLEQDGFSKNPFFHGIIAEVPEQHKSKEGDGKTPTRYSTRQMQVFGCETAVASDKKWLYLCFLGKGIGKALMSKVAQLGLAAGCHQLNFTVLDWNKSSVDFYLHQGCTDVTTDMGYHYMSCKGEAMEHLAQP